MDSKEEKMSAKVAYSKTPQALGNAQSILF